MSASGPPAAAGAAAGRPPRPAAMDAAVRLMYLGAVLAAAGALSAVLGRDRLRAEIGRGLGADGQVAPDVTATAFSVGLAIGVGLGLLTAVLWVLNAVLNGRGVGWARILSTALAVAAVVGFVPTATQPRPLLDTVLEVGSVLVAVVVVVLLWRPESSRFYAEAAAARRAGRP